MKTANKLRQFRQQCEKDAGTPSAAIHVPLLSVLVDVCRTLKLSKKQTRQVIGEQGHILLRAGRRYQFGPASRPVIYKPRQPAN